MHLIRRGLRGVPEFRSALDMRARLARGPLLTKAIRVPAEGEIPKHESHYYLELLRRAGWIQARLEIAPIRLHNLGGGAYRWCRIHCAARRRRGREKLALRHRSRRVLRRGKMLAAWNISRKLADRLISECGAADVIFFGTAGEKEIAARICSHLKLRAISLVGETSMRDLAAVFASCSIFIGNDSGAMHVAAAAGLPVIGIFCSDGSGGNRACDRAVYVDPRKGFVQSVFFAALPGGSPLYDAHCRRFRF